MKHPLHVWTDPSYAEESIARLSQEYVQYLEGRAQAASPVTLEKYGKSLRSFLRSLERNADALVLGSLTPQAVNRWVTEQRKEGRSEDGIASRLSAVKVFAKKYIFEHLELTTGDLLRKVPRIVPPERPMPALTEGEREALLACYDKPSYEDVRNKAFVAVYLATGLRFREVLELELARLDRISSEVQVRVKGGRERVVRISSRALKLVKEYLKLRPARATSGRVWLTVDGAPLSYWGGQSVFRRLRDRSGVSQLHAHLLRHTFAQVALEKVPSGPRCRT
jgi:site-specific recombinase XerD